MNKRRFITGLTFAFLGAIALILPNVTFAVSDASSCFSVTGGLQITSCVTWFAYIISYVIAGISTFVFAIESFALHMAINLNFSIANNPGVQLGFSVVLAFANILFVAAVIVMAVATIIRYDAYGARAVLFRIVIAAIGVNFSLIMAGTVMNISDQVTKFLLNNSIPNRAADQGVGVRSFVDNLAGAFNPGKLYDLNVSSTEGAVSGTLVQEGGSVFGTMIAAVAGIYMTAIMSILMAIFMGILAGSFFVRFIFLGLLLTVAPAAWVAWIFPFGSGFVQWWKANFIKWTLFAPVVMFFLYLSVKTLEVYNGMHLFDTATIKKELAAPSSMGDYLNGGISAIAAPLVENIIKFTLVAGTLYGGLLLAAKMGIKAGDTGSKVFEKFGGSIKRNVQNRVTSGGMRSFDRLRTFGKDEKGNSKLQQWGSKADALAQRSRLARWTGVGVAGRQAANLGTADKKSMEERQKGYEDSLKNLSPAALQERLRRQRNKTLAPNADEERAIVKLLREKKELGDIGKNTFQAKEDDEIKAFREAHKAGGDTPLSESQIAAEVARIKGKYAQNRNKEEQNLRDQFKRLSDAGALKDILSAAPKLARFAPATKTKDAAKRPMTEEEMIAAATATAKGENIESIAYETDMFGSKAPLTELGDKLTPEQLSQLLNVNAVSSEQLKQIGDRSIDTVAAFKNTLEMIKAYDEELKVMTKDDKNRKWRALDEHLVDDDVPGANKISRRNAVIKANSHLKVLDRNVNLVTRVNQYSSNIATNQDTPQPGQATQTPIVNPTIDLTTRPSGPGAS